MPDCKDRLKNLSVSSSYYGAHKQKKMVPIRHWNNINIFNILRESSCHPRTVYTVKLSGGKEEKIKVLFGQMKKLETF